MSFELYVALTDDDMEEVKKLIGQGNDIQRTTEGEKWSYLHKVCMSDDNPTKSVQFLIEQGLDVNAVDSYGRTPLIWAAEQGNIEAMKLLLDNGAIKTLEHCDANGTNALRININRNPFPYEKCKLLLEYVANPDQGSEVGKSIRDVIYRFKELEPEAFELFSKY